MVRQLTNSDRYICLAGCEGPLYTLAVIHRFETVTVCIAYLKLELKLLYLLSIHGSARQNARLCMYSIHCMFTVLVLEHGFNRSISHLPS